MTSKEDTINLSEDKPDSFIFSKPKKNKNADIMVCKVKNKNNEQVIVQFPKMTLVSDYQQQDKFIELEFINEIGYNKKMYNFLSKLDEHLLTHISSQSETWFNKNISVENVQNMYNKFIKAPKTSENKCTIKFIFDKVELIDKKNEEIGVSELVKGVTVECISQMKYIIFSKDIAFVNWEICTVKVHKPRGKKVPGNGFIEDPVDVDEIVESDEELDINSFF